MVNYTKRSRATAQYSMHVQSISDQITTHNYHNLFAINVIEILSNKCDGIPFYSVWRFNRYRAFSIYTMHLVATGLWMWTEEIHLRFKREIQIYLMLRVLRGKLSNHPQFDVSSSPPERQRERARRNDEILKCWCSSSSIRQILWTRLEITEMPKTSTNSRTKINLIGANILQLF